MSGADLRVVSGWGRTSPARCTVHEIPGVDGVRDVLAGASGRGVLARGLGRAYGDAAQNTGGDLVRLTGDGIVLDAPTGVATVDAGVSLDAVLRRVVPAGWFVPVTPGTRFVTVGGAVAADVHGKNHHRDSSIGAWVDSIDMVLASGEQVTVTPDADGDLFWATVGGMGLTGVITSLTLRLIPIGTSRVRVDTRRFDHIDALMASMVERDADHRYSVAWVDATVTGSRLGRGVVTWGDHAGIDDLPTRDRHDPLAYSPSQRVGVPGIVGSVGVVNRWTAAAFAAAWFRKAPRSRDGELQSIPAFFHPLDGVADWNRVYGRRGFVQYQFVVPDTAADVVPRVLDRVAVTRPGDFLNVLKRFGPAGSAMLSFPTAGWTLTLDLPVVDGVAGLLADLDAMVLTAGGRVYLAKDAQTTPAMIGAGYPRLAEWRAVRDRVDPNRVFTSDLARRLDL